MSLALAHKRRVLAGGAPTRKAAATPVYTAEDALKSPANAQKHLKLMETALAGDLERLSAINSLELRQQLKREELLPKYCDYVRRYRESGLNYPNPVLMQVLVWLFDTEQFEEGLELALFAIEQGQTLPERFKRDVPTFVADQVIEWAEAEHKAGRSPEPYVSNLLPLVEGWKLFERIPARYHKLLGLLAMEREDWAEAIARFDAAEALYPEIGVSTRRAACEKALRKQQAEQQPE